MQDTTVATTEAATFWRYISSTLDRLIDLATTMDHAGLHWTPPAKDANSIAVLVAHTMGNAEENILATLCGDPATHRQADEFVVRPITAADLSDQWATLRSKLEGGLADLQPSDLDAIRNHPRRGPIKGREVLIVVARHAAEHLGRAGLTRDLWQATR